MTIWVIKLHNHRGGFFNLLEETKSFILRKKVEEKTAIEIFIWKFKINRKKIRNKMTQKCQDNNVNLSIWKVKYNLL